MSAVEPGRLTPILQPERTSRVGQTTGQLTTDIGLKPRGVGVVHQRLRTSPGAVVERNCRSAGIHTVPASVVRPAALKTASAGLAPGARNPVWTWLLSQNGLFFDCPHRHRAARGS